MVTESFTPNLRLGFYVVYFRAVSSTDDGWFFANRELSLKDTKHESAESIFNHLLTPISVNILILQEWTNSRYKVLHVN